jgi:hypothetical protein
LTERDSPIGVTTTAATASTDAGATLETVLDQLELASSLTPRERGEMSSAIYSFARKVSRLPAEIPARLDVIERLGLELNAVRLGISMGRQRNLRSLVRRSLEITGHTALRARLDLPLRYPWSACVDLFSDRRTRIALARLFRIFQVLGIAPAEISTASFGRVLQYLRAVGTPRSEANYRELALAWNRLVTLLRPYRT